MPDSGPGIEKGEAIMDRDERIMKAAAIWSGCEIFGENQIKTKEGKTLTPKEALREYDVTEEEIREFLDALDDSDPADEPWNSEDTKVLLGWLGVIVAVILVIVALILVI